MTILGTLRNNTGRRRRPQMMVDINADNSIVRSTGDPRLDLARAINQASRR